MWRQVLIFSVYSSVLSFFFRFWFLQNGIAFFGKCMIVFPMCSKSQLNLPKVTQPLSKTIFHIFHLSNWVIFDRNPYSSYMAAGTDSTGPILTMLGTVVLPVIVKKKASFVWNQLVRMPSVRRTSPFWEKPSEISRLAASVHQDNSC